MTRAAGVMLSLLALGCTYFNGVYNARAAARDGDRLSRAGRESAATEAYALAASTAESVLAREPRGRWASEARFIAGRSAALAGECGRATARLRQFLAAPSGDSVRMVWARVALGTCLARRGDYTDALALLAGGVGSRDRALARTAALWGARAASALGRDEEARAYLAALPPADADWEGAATALRRGDDRDAESALAARAAAGDVRDIAYAALDDLWVRGSRDAAMRIVAAYDAAGVPPTPAAAAARARLHLVLAQRAAADGADSLARAHFRVARMAADSGVGTAAMVDETVLVIRRARTLDAAGRALDSAPPAARAGPALARMRDAYAFVVSLATRADPTGAALFLAGEAARDSLGAPAIAASLFARVARDYPGALLAPKALLAAAALRPDSAEIYAQRVREQYGTSPDAVLLAGGDPSGDPVFSLQAEQLRRAWAAASAPGDTAARRAGALPGLPSPAEPRDRPAPIRPVNPPAR